MSVQSDLVGRANKILGMRASNIPTMPSVLPNAYAVAWKEFLATGAATQLRTFRNSNYLLGLAFVSFLLGLDKKALTLKYSFAPHNVNYVKAELQPTWDIIRDKLQRTKLKRGAKLLKHEVATTGTDNKFLGALTNTEFVGYLVYKAQGQSVEQLIQAQQSLLFKASIPRHLMRKGKLSYKAAKTVNSHPWYDLIKPGRDNYSLAVIRTQEDLFVIRYTVTMDVPYFYGNSQELKTAEKQRLASWKLISKVN